MRTGPSGRYLHALVVVDVDLDAGRVTRHPQPTASGTAPEGVHALVWAGGRPVGELTVPGDPEAVLPRLPGIAAAEVGRPPPEPAPRRSGAVLGAADVTVAVCSRDRPDDLARCLAALGAMTTRVAEVLVVDNGSRDDRTREVAAGLPSVRYVREPRAGLGWARDRALLEARTPVVAFTDDDVLVHPGWIEGVLRGYAEVPGAVVVTGLVAPLELATPAQVLFEARGFGRGYRRRVLRADPGRAGRLAGALGDVGTGAALAVLREPVLALGGFDPALGVGTPTAGGEDHELVFRVLVAGGAVVYEPSAVVFHRHRTTFEGLAGQRRGDGTGAYSWWIGAGGRYGRAERAALRRQALRWGLVHHGRNLARSVLYPELWPPALSWAEARGAALAATGGPYRRALAQVAREAAAHPGEPAPPSLVHPSGR